MQHTTQVRSEPLQPPDPSGLVTVLGIRLTHVTSDRVIGMLDVGEHHLQPHGIVHGGVYCTLAETVASEGADAWAREQGMIGSVGVSNATDFLRSTRSGTLTAEAIPVHRGRTQQLWSVTIMGAHNERLVATARVRMHNVVDSAALGG